jgi:hypothetical protein
MAGRHSCCPQLTRGRARGVGAGCARAGGQGWSPADSACPGRSSPAHSSMPSLVSSDESDSGLCSGRSGSVHSSMPPLWDSSDESEGGRPAAVRRDASPWVPAPRLLPLPRVSPRWVGAHRSVVIIWPMGLPRRPWSVGSSSTASTSAGGCLSSPGARSVASSGSPSPPRCREGLSLPRRSATASAAGRAELVPGAL